jgi:hypothetical protein
MPMRSLRSYIFPSIVLVSVIFLISACTNVAVDDKSDKDNTDTAVIDNDSPSQDTPVKGSTEDVDNPLKNEEDTTDDTKDTEDTTDETTDTADEPETTTTDSETATISGKFCYPTSPIPSDLRVYVKNKKTGYYWYITRKAQTEWSMSDLEPATYVIYLAGTEGSTLEEGRYTNADHSFKEIEVKAGDKVTGVEPCDFDF